MHRDHLADGWAVMMMMMVVVDAPVPPNCDRGGIQSSCCWRGLADMGVTFLRLMGGLTAMSGTSFFGCTVRGPNRSVIAEKTCSRWRVGQAFEALASASPGPIHISPSRLDKTSDSHTQGFTLVTYEYKCSSLLSISCPPRSLLLDCTSYIYGTTHQCG